VLEDKGDSITMDLSATQQAYGKKPHHYERLFKMLREQSALSTLEFTNTMHELLLPLFRSTPAGVGGSR
jgi:hypothetical protein